jgi:hypothetical protein
VYLRDESEMSGLESQQETREEDRIRQQIDHQSGAEIPSCDFEVESTLG